MKKIIAFLLVIGCMLSLAACKPDEVEKDNSDVIPEIQAKIDASAPLGADITVVFKTALGDLNGTYGVTYNADGTAAVEYSYEKFNTIDEDDIATELKSTVSGTATVAADGTVSGDLGSGDALNAVSFDLNLSADKLSSVYINAGILTAKVKAADTAAVLGVALDYDVDITVTTGNGVLTAMSVFYVTSLGEVEIVTTYR